MINIYTDGSSRGNPGPGGWAAILSDENKVAELGGKEDHTTNNRMELMGAIKALEFAIIDFPPTKIILNTDSEYVMKGITLWVKSWQLKGWKTAAKKPVLNQDLWQELIKMTEGREIEWKYVAGHAGVAANERCDEIATQFADGESPHLYHGPKQGYQFVF